MDATRRGFLGLLGGGLIAAPAILRLPLEMTPRGVILPPLPIAEWGVYEGVIIREVNELSREEMVDQWAKMICFRKEVIREYVRQNLFAPYVGDERKTVIRILRDEHGDEI